MTFNLWCNVGTATTIKVSSDVYTTLHIALSLLFGCFFFSKIFKSEFMRDHIRYTKNVKYVTNSAVNVIEGCRHCLLL